MTNELRLQHWFDRIKSFFLSPIGIYLIAKIHWHAEIWLEIHLRRKNLSLPLFKNLLRLQTFSLLYSLSDGQQWKGFSVYRIMVLFFYSLFDNNKFSACLLFAVKCFLHWITANIRSIGCHKLLKGPTCRWWPPAGTEKKPRRVEDNISPEMRYTQFYILKEDAFIRLIWVPESELGIYHTHFFRIHPLWKIHCWRCPIYFKPDLNY